MSQPRYLTKSRFKLAMECPTKLFYTGKPEYENCKLEDRFLQHLADGGFQVGKLAQCYFPGGVEITTREYDESVAQTNELLKQDQVTIYEGAFRHENLFIRADIVVKRGNAIELIEVKAKSCDFETEDGCWDKRKGPTFGQIKSDWYDYIADVAFQKYVIEQGYPFNVTAHLLLADKTSACPTEGLNQKFRLVTVNGNRKVEISRDLSGKDLEPWILRKICVEASCSKVYQNVEAEPQEAETRTVASVFSLPQELDQQLNANSSAHDGGRQTKAPLLRKEGTSSARADDGVVESLSPFARMISRFAHHYATDSKITPAPSKACKSCEFRSDDPSMKSGFHECWMSTFGWAPADFDEHTVLDLWKFQRKDDLIISGKLKLSTITPEEIAPKTKPKESEFGMNLYARQCLQIQVATLKNFEPHLDREGIAAEMANWKFPLHFIDFETCRPAIPFRAGRRPYEGIAFQFSHHVVDEDGRVEHAGEFLEATPGKFPSYDLVRELKRQLENDEGSIFRYHMHENSVLCETRDQLLSDPSEIDDRDELVAFIESITQPRNKKDHPGDTWDAGPRNMVDLCKMVERYYYHHDTRGSISLKYILPAILKSSEFLQTKYSQPIYGTHNGIKSLNFKNKVWVTFEDDDKQSSQIQNPKSEIQNPAGSPPSKGGVAAASADGVVVSSSARKVRDPYACLGAIMPDESEHDNDVLNSAWYEEEIRDGGAAMTAYCKLQFTDVADETRRAIETSLKRYCELDTLAMVMIYEAWKAEIDR